LYLVYILQFLVAHPKFFSWLRHCNAPFPILSKLNYFKWKESWNMVEISHFWWKLCTYNIRKILNRASGVLVKQMRKESHKHLVENFWKCVSEEEQIRKKGHHIWFYNFSKIWFVFNEVFVQGHKWKSEGWNLKRNRGGGKKKFLSFVRGKIQAQK
jgi:hypothetical protein